MDFLASRRTVIGSKVDQMTIVLLHDKTNRDRHRRIPRWSADKYPCVIFCAKKNMFRDGLSSKQKNRDWIESWSNDDCSSSRQNLTGIVIVESAVGPPINTPCVIFCAKKNMFRDGLSSKQRNRDWIERWSNNDCSSSRQIQTGIVIVESPVGPPINTHASSFARRRTCFVMDFLASRGTVIGSKGDQMMIVLLHDEI